jgi:hypothetical protein
MTVHVYDVVRQVTQPQIDLTMTQEHPITPPEELVDQWNKAWIDAKVKHEGLVTFIATQAAHWGADQELEACCEWLKGHWLNADLRAHRRFKPPTKEEALDELFLSFDRGYLKKESAELIRRALESLPD